MYGKIDFEPSGMTVWWLDENFQQHSRYLEPGEPVPHFLCVEKRGAKVLVRGVGKWSVCYEG